MSADDRYLLEQIVSQEHQKNAPTLKKDNYFEIFSAEQIIKLGAFDLDTDQIRSGIVAGGNDGGVDSIFLFVNRKLVREDTDLSQFRAQQLTIELLITQSKNTGGFSETAVTKLSDFTENCLRLTSDLARATRKLYSQALLEAVGRFHDIYKEALSFHPSLSIRYYYATLGEQIDPKVTIRKDLLLGRCKELFSTAECTFDFVDAKKLLTWFHRAPTKTTSLETVKTMNWSAFGTAYLCLVHLRKFYDFITDKDKNDALRGHIFEANVRDYQGQVSVNKEIRASLAASGSEEFWWLNNGISVIASKVISSGDVFAITDPLIVNGLQTSFEIYNHFRQPNVADDKRTILVRVIENTDPQSVDRIIKATNSQTTIPRVWLHATEEIHRKIESALRSVDLYYDRRKNFYRNQGIAATNIVTIPYLAQALAAIVLQRPDDARARPTTVAERYYKQLFSNEFPIDLYGKCALILKRADAFLDGVDDLESGHRLNILFYLAMYMTCAELKSAKPRRSSIAGLVVASLTDSFITPIYHILKAKYLALGGDDKVAKGTALAEELKVELHEKFVQTRRKRKAQ
jgi:hypothetical protein